MSKATSAVKKKIPERNLVINSSEGTRFFRLSTSTQIMAGFLCTALMGWGVFTSANYAVSSFTKNASSESSEQTLGLYENRLTQLTEENSIRTQEAINAQNKLNAILDNSAQMQVELIEAQERIHELELGISTMQDNLRLALKERSDVEEQFLKLENELNENEERADFDALSEADQDIILAILDDVLTERDDMNLAAQEAIERSQTLETDLKLIHEKNDRIFSQLEDAVTLSVKPLDDMFKDAGLNPDQIIKQIRQRYSGTGGPLTPISFPMQDGTEDPDSLRANAIIAKMDTLNLYRIAAQKTPFAMPVKGSFRFTSGFGPRWGRMHKGTDFAAAHGAPIYATADGVVTFAGRQSGYGNIVKIQHDFGIETRYAHLSAINVKKGQKVSLGRKIGAMGNTGRSTGTHLHYEVRINGEAINPMIYIKAARDVF